jgi:hypothetical protein
LRLIGKKDELAIMVNVSPTIRREEASALNAKLASLSGYTDREDFHVFAHDVLAALRSTIEKLDACDEEGNACEIFRLIRDSLMDGGWDAYRRDRVRNTVAQLLCLLSENEVVTAQDAFRASDELDGMGVLQLPPLLVDTDELSD